MPKRIPIAAAKKIAKDHDLRQVVLVAWDGSLTHVVTYGKTVLECDQAAMGGDRIKKILGWPESLNATPSRVKKLERELAALRLTFAEVQQELVDTKGLLKSAELERKMDRLT